MPHSQPRRDESSTRSRGQRAKLNPSFFSKPGGGTLIGEKLFPDFISLRTDPFHPLFSSLPWIGRPLGDSGYRPGAAGGADFGVPAERIPWIEKGVLKNLAYDRYWAGKTDSP